MSKIEKKLLLGLGLLLLVYAVVVVSVGILDGLLLRLLVIAFGLLLVVFWIWYFEIDVGRLWEWRLLMYGVIVSGLIWFSVRTLWSLMSYGVFVGFEWGGLVERFGLFFTYSMLCIVVYGFWLRRELRLYLDKKYYLLILASIFSAAVLLIFGDISVVNYVVLVLVWYFAYSLGDIFGYGIVLGFVLGFFMFDSVINYYLANDGLFVVGMPGPKLVEVLAIMVGIFLLARLENR